MNHPDRDTMGRLPTGKPVGHFCEKPNSFSIQRFIAALDDSDVRDIAISVYYKTASDPTFYAAFICISRILSVFVDVVKESLIASGKGRFDFHIIIFKHLFVGLQAIA